MSMRRPGHAWSSAQPITVRRVLGILPPGERAAVGVVVAVMLVAAGFETAGVASILPFMAVVMDPGIIERSGTFAAIVRALGATTRAQALTVVAGLVLAALVLGNVSAAAGQWIHQKFLIRIRRRLATELFAGYLAQPYAFHVKHDAAVLNKVLSNDVEAVISNALGPFFTMVTRAAVVVGLLALVLVRDPVVAFATILLLGGAYFVIYRAMRGPQARIGEELSQASVERWRTTIEGLGGIKELIVLGRERATVDRFERATRRMYHLQFLSAMSATLPRYLLEIVAFGGIIFVTLALVLREGGAQAAIPTLALYAFVGYRLMPALQQIFASAVTSQFASAALDALERDLALVRSTQSVDVPAQEPAPGGRRTVRFERVQFTYPGAPRPALRDVSLVIRPNESIGLVGRTGSGKTTLADLLLGLYQPTAGAVLVGDQPLDGAGIRAWRQHVGYVPQSVFLANASIAQNIAFGLPDEEIDQLAVARAARMAQADEFIASLPDGFATIVGERGVKLSGGQRQRLGIARALYHDPEMLVFDEATSALDGMTEEAVMQAIQTLSTHRTIILIAHRLRTIEACDRILMMENGSIIGDGTYQELLDHSPEFRHMVARGAPGATAASVPGT